jgi:hypothetical protein
MRKRSKVAIPHASVSRSAVRKAIVRHVVEFVGKPQDRTMLRATHATHTALTRTQRSTRRPKPGVARNRHTSEPVSSLLPPTDAATQHVFVRVRRAGQTHSRCAARRLASSSKASASVKSTNASRSRLRNGGGRGRRRARPADLRDARSSVFQSSRLGCSSYTRPTTSSLDAPQRAPQA